MISNRYYLFLFYKINPTIKNIDYGYNYRNCESQGRRW